MFDLGSRGGAVFFTPVPGVYTAAFKQTALQGGEEGGTQIKSKPGNPEELTEGEHRPRGTLAMAVDTLLLQLQTAAEVAATTFSPAYSSLVYRQGSGKNPSLGQISLLFLMDTQRLGLYPAAESP